MRRWLKQVFCCAHKRKWDELELAPPYEPASLVNAPRTQEAGPRTVIVKYFEAQIQQAEEEGNLFVVVPGAALDAVVGYTPPTNALRDALRVVMARRTMLAAEGNNGEWIFDWRSEEMDLLTNPKRAGEPEDGL